MRPSRRAALQDPPPKPPPTRSLPDSLFRSLWWLLPGLGVRPDQEWNKACGLTSEGDSDEQVGISPEKAKQTFKVRLAAQVTDDILEK